MVSCGELTLAGCQVPTRATLSLLLFIWTEKRKYNKRLMSRNEDKERSLTNCHHGQNRLKFGKINSIYYQIKSEKGNEK